MGEQHLDPLAIPAGLVECRRVIEGPGHIASRLIDVAGDSAMGRIRTALQFERAQIVFPPPAFLAGLARARRGGARVGLIVIGDHGTPPVMPQLSPFLCGAEHVAASPGEVPWEPMVEAIRRVSGTDPLAAAGRDEVRFLLYGCHTEERVLASALFLRSILGYTHVAVSPHLVGIATSEAHLAALRHHLPRAGVEILLRLEDAASYLGVDGSALGRLGCTACQIEPPEFREQLGETARQIVELLCLHWTKAQLRSLGAFINVLCYISVTIV